MMNTSNLINFGFRFQVKGKEYIFHLLAESKEDLLARFEAIKQGEFLGEVRIDEMFLPNITYCGIPHQVISGEECQQEERENYFEYQEIF